MTKKEIFDLLREWCDTLLTYQIKEQATPYLHGGLVCPACHVMHGRCADLVLPLLTLYSETGEERYVTAAEELVDWTEFNHVRPDGSYVNDAGSLWKGITAFSSLALGETLLRFGGLLKPATKEKWMKIFARQSEFIYGFFDKAKPVINYYAGASAQLALAYRLTGERKYLDKANSWERFCRDYFNEDGLLCGEGHPIDFVSEKGCRPIDMGYDTEESVPLLIEHAEYAGDAEKLRFYAARMLDHMEFLLPDGAIDNSFGTRHNKWTYWGSRTSDGALEGLAHIAGLAPEFSKAAVKIFELYKRCTRGGLLCAGLMTTDAGEPTCLHHTFCHAKAIAELYLCADGDGYSCPDCAVLPREREYGVKTFQKGNLALVSVGGWRATVSACDAVFYPGADNGGGSLNLLWHEKYGPLCAATMYKYNPSEPLNMQYQRNSDDIRCLTPRIDVAGTSSVCDRTVTLKASSEKGVTTVCAHGAFFDIGYRFTSGALEITVRSDKAGVYHLPIAAMKDVSVTCDGVRAEVGGVVRLSCPSGISLPGGVSARRFNQVGGLECVPFELPLKAGAEARITVEII